MSGNNPVTFNSPKAPKHQWLRIARGHTLDRDGCDPVLASTIAEIKKRGRKYIGYTVDHARDEYVFKMMAPRNDGTDGDAEGDKPRVYVP